MHHKFNDMSLCFIIEALSVFSSLSLNIETLLNVKETYVYISYYTSLDFVTLKYFVLTHISC